ncbi:MAG TPA: glycosyltransferase family A protein [Solirubrobacterales bacterium]|nr:glycosyltransferase family A protein [Solirubrobacterales bacterium]
MAEGSRFGSGARQAAKRLRSKLYADLLDRVLELHGAFDDLNRMLRREFDQVHARLDQLENIEAQIRGSEAIARRTSEIARHLYDEEPANRRRLHQLRASEEYELAFSEDEPLVTFIVPTYRSFETLRDVALPSILGQNYSNLEVIVSGDCAPPETAAAVASFDDPRLVYLNRTIRGPYPEDPSRRWFAIGGPPYNDALAIARGRWIAALGDDDAIRPHHTEVLLAAAREHRWEHCYGLQQVNFAEGEPLVIGEFPPRMGHWGLQGALYHSGLRYFESELSDAIYEEPSDWSKCRRMIRAGVRFGMLDEILVDKEETRRRSAQEWQQGEVPIAE